jgi:hypothetical protein
MAYSKIPAFLCDVQSPQSVWGHFLGSEAYMTEFCWHHLGKGNHPSLLMSFFSEECPVHTSCAPGPQPLPNSRWTSRQPLKTWQGCSWVHVIQMSSCLAFGLLEGHILRILKVNLFL